MTEKLHKLSPLKLCSLLGILVIFTACTHQKVPKGDTKATVIEYKVNYLTEKAGKIPTKMLPSKMTVVFAGHYAMNRIEGFFGQFSLIYIGNLKTESVTTLLKLFDKKYVYYGVKGELPCGFIDPGPLEIRKTGNSREISGFFCNELEIKASGQPDILVYSTDRIKIKNPNVTTPYKEINEVLLQFNTQLSLLEMNLTASSVQEMTVSWDIFRVTEDYKEREREFMENTINELFK